MCAGHEKSSEYFAKPLSVRLSRSPTAGHSTERSALAQALTALAFCSRFHLSNQFSMCHMGAGELSPWNCCFASRSRFPKTIVGLVASFLIISRCDEKFPVNAYQILRICALKGTAYKRWSHLLFKIIIRHEYSIIYPRRFILTLDSCRFSPSGRVLRGSRGRNSLSRETCMLERREHFSRGVTLFRCFTAAKDYTKTLPRVERLGIKYVRIPAISSYSWTLLTDVALYRSSHCF